MFKINKKNGITGEILQFIFTLSPVSTEQRSESFTIDKVTNYITIDVHKNIYSKNPLPSEEYNYQVTFNNNTYPQSKIVKRRRREL